MEAPLTKIDCPNRLDQRLPISYNSAFATSVLPERKSLSTTPRKIVLSSGRPEPAAVGATRAIRPALKHTSMVGSVDLRN